jgi:hypothetical protein
MEPREGNKKLYFQGINTATPHTHTTAESDSMCYSSHTISLLKVNILWYDL